MSQENLTDLKIWTSHLRRTIETAELIPCASVAHWKALDELDAVSKIFLHRFFIVIGWHVHAFYSPGMIFSCPGVGNDIRLIWFE